MTEQTVKMMEKTFEEIKKDKTIKGVCLLAMDENKHGVCAMAGSNDYIAQLLTDAVSAISVEYGDAEAFLEIFCEAVRMNLKQKDCGIMAAQNEDEAVKAAQSIMDEILNNKKKG